MTAQLQFRNLTLGYDRHPAVHHLDGAVEAGTLTAVVGPNGAGKSTLFKGVVGVIKPLAGSVDRGGLSPQDIAYLPQIAEIDRSFPINVYDMVAMGLWRGKGLFGSIGAKDRDTIESAIATVGLTGFESRAIGTLSGRADAAHAVRAAAVAGRAGDRARRAVQRHRRQDLGRSARAGASLAQREAHRAGRAARSRARARRIFRRRCCSRASRWPGAPPRTC